MFCIKLWTWSLGVFTTLSFVLCVIWGLVTPEALHMHKFLESVLPAFHWISPAAFVLGLIESFLWGAYTGLVFVPIYNFFYRRFGVTAFKA
jgi:uncharacterized membrane-anchored protein